MMKWWGWGSENMSFPMENKPNLWPWIRNKLGLQSEITVSPIQLDKIVLSAPIHLEAFVSAVSEFLSSDQIKTDKRERLLHSYGDRKSVV